MNSVQIEKIVSTQREYFLSGKTLEVEKRRNYLINLKTAIKKYQAEICSALYLDLGKSDGESYMCEIGLTLSEISFLLKNLKRFTKKQRVKTPLSHFPAKSFMYPSPYGTVLIMSPWNYPFLLSVEPLAEAIAAGNTVVLKPSDYSRATDAVIIKILSEVFPPEVVSVVTGGREENKSLLEIKFDYIFFTGSKTVGKIVYQKAAKYLTPVTLELGGKSPCIVDKTANLPLAARRIVFGKFLNAGQTCVAPDYILVHESVKDGFIKEVKREIVRQFGENPLSNDAFGKIISERHFERLVSLIDKDKIAYGGLSDKTKRKIQPTVLENVSYNDPCMQEEIFGPIMPVITYRDIDRVISKINSEPSPLALYVFTSDRALGEKVIKTCRYGGGCVNDVIMHLATSYMPFGGFGDSGLGSYHGKKGFETFSHYKSIVDKKTYLDVNLRYQPYSENDKKLFEKFLK